MKSKITLKHIGIFTSGALLATVLVGSVIAYASSLPTDKAKQANTEHKDTIAQNISINTNITENYIGESQAKAIALEHAGLKEDSVSHLLCKLDVDDGIAEYEVEFWDGTTEYDYEINAVSGAIIAFDYDMESYDAKPSTDSTTYITESQAKALALKHAGVNETEASNIKCEFDYDDGVAEYEIEWKINRTDYEYTINAVDGTIQEYDIEDDD